MKYLIPLIFAALIICGCSHTLHERKPDPSNPSDKGTETAIELRGPKAQISHKF